MRAAERLGNLEQLIIKCWTEEELFERFLEQYTSLKSENPNCPETLTLSLMAEPISHLLFIRGVDKRSLLTDIGVFVYQDNPELLKNWKYQYRINKASKIPAMWVQEQFFKIADTTDFDGLFAKNGS